MPVFVLIMGIMRHRLTFQSSWRLSTSSLHMIPVLGTMEAIWNDEAAIKKYLVLYPF